MNIRQKTKSMTHKAILLSSSLLLMAMGEFCDNGLIDPPSDNIGRISDLVMVSPFPLKDSIAPTLIVSSNPQLQQLRVYNSYSCSYEVSENGYFPLSVETGPLTSRLCKSPSDESRIYTLDVQDDVIRILRTKPEDGNKSFTYVGSGIRTLRAPSDIASVIIDEDIVRIFVTIPNEELIQSFTVNHKTGKLLTEKRIQLPEFSKAMRLKADPSGDAILVTDTILSSVHVIKVASEALDRSINIGGSSFELDIGWIDSGDGLAPMAIVLRNDKAEAAAIRLFRPGYREDAYQLYGKTELPSLGAITYVPRQITKLTDPSVCCTEITRSSEATRAWASIITENGNLFYLRFDAPLLFSNPDVEDEKYVSKTIRLLDDYSAEAGLLTQTAFDNPRFISSDGETEKMPLLELSKVNNLGSPATAPFYPQNLILSFIYEGTPPGLTNRQASFENNSILVEHKGKNIDERDVKTGDHLRIIFEHSETQCSDISPILTMIEDIQSDRIQVTLSDTQKSCLQDSLNLRIDVEISDEFIVLSSAEDYLGRLAFSDTMKDNTSIEIPELRFKISPNSNGKPAKNSILIAEIVQNLVPIGISLAREVELDSRSYSSEISFAQDALVPTAIVGGELYLPPTQLIRSNKIVRRVYISTAGLQGRVLEVNEGEADIRTVSTDAYRCQ